MKNALLLALAMQLFALHFLLGQARSPGSNFDFGLRAGGKLSTMLYNDGADQCSAELFGIISTETFVPRYFLGAHADYSFKDNMSVSLGVQYVFKGGGEEFTMPDPTNPSQRISGTLDNRIKYLQIPIQYNLKFKNYHIGLGGYWGYVLSGEQMWELDGSDPESIDMSFGQNAEDHMKKTDLGMNIELGYRLTDHLQIFAHFQQGLSPQMSAANRETFKSLGYDWKFYHQAYGLGLTFFIPQKG